MEITEEIKFIVDKLSRKEKFGLYDKGSKCYFEDGTRIGYQSLWKAIRIVNKIEDGTQCKTLGEECPDTYLGSFNRKFSKNHGNYTLNVISRFVDVVMGK
jgi:hypothetical protein